MSQAPSGIDQFFSGDWVRDLFSNPLFGLGASLFMGGGLKFGLPAMLAASDIAATESENERNRQMRDLFNEQLQFDRQQALDLAARVPNFFDPTTGQIFGPDAGFARPDLRGGGFSQLGKPGQGEGISDNLITLPEFNVGQTALEAFLNLLPSQEERTIGFTPMEQLAPNQLFGQLESLGVLPETDLSEVLGARLGGIDAAGLGREQQRQQEVAALAPQFGGLENLRGVLGATSAQEGAFRGLEAQQVTGQTRAEELEAQKFVSTVAGNLTDEEARLNLAIGQFNRGSQFTTENVNISRELALAQTLSGLEAGAAGDQQQRVAFLIDAISNSLGLQSNLFGQASTGTLNQLVGQIPLLQQNVALSSSFLPSITPQRFAGVNPSGGGDRFNIDLASAAGIGAGALGGLGGLGGGTAAGAGGFSGFGSLMGLFGI